MYEMINHPTHYQQSGRKECIAEMIDVYGKKNVALWCRMTTYKYCYRAGDKPDNSYEQDMKKCDWYLDKATELETELNIELLRANLD